MPTEIKHELEPFMAAYPESAHLGLVPVKDAVGQYHDGFDVEEVEKALGAERFVELMKTVKSVFCCGHRLHPPDYADKVKAGTEVHCIYARDLELFLKDLGPHT